MINVDRSPEFIAAGRSLVTDRRPVPVEPEARFSVFGHCASGYRELWDVVPSREEAEALARKILADYPVELTDEGRVNPDGGGVVWVEVFGPGIEESLGFERTLVRP